MPVSLISGVSANRSVTVGGQPTTIMTALNVPSVVGQQAVVAVSPASVKPVMNNAQPAQIKVPEKTTTAKQAMESTTQSVAANHNKVAPKHDFTKQDTIAGIIGGLVGLALAWGALVWFKKL